MGGSLSRRLRSQKGADQGLSPARSAASQALKRVQEEGAYASEAIEALINATDIPASDKAFAATLVRGVVRTQGVLDQMLDGYLEKPNRVRPDVRRALQIAAYEERTLCPKISQRGAPESGCQRSSVPHGLPRRGVRFVLPRVRVPVGVGRAALR